VLQHDNIPVTNKLFLVCLHLSCSRVGVTNDRAACSWCVFNLHVHVFLVCLHLSCSRVLGVSSSFMFTRVVGVSVHTCCWCVFIFHVRVFLVCLHLSCSCVLVSSSFMFTCWCDERQGGVQQQPSTSERLLVHQPLRRLEEEEKGQGNKMS